MLCKNCGRQISNEMANFCEYCGVSLRTTEEFMGNTADQRAQDTNPGAGQADDPYAAYGSYQNNRNRPFGGQGRYSSTGKNGERKKFSWLRASEETEEEPVVSFGQWLLVVLVLPLIPGIGPFLYLVALFLIGFGKISSQTLKNWARAMLIMLVVGFIALFTLFNQMGQLLGGVI